MHYITKTKETLFVIIVMIAFAFPCEAVGQVKTIGVIMPRGIKVYEEIHKHFMADLKKRGYGRDKVRVIVQRPSIDKMSIINSARKFVAVDVDIIMTHGAMATLAALSETGKVPIIFSSVFDPEREGLASGGVSVKKNATGIASKIPVEILIESMQQMKPVKRLALLYNPAENDSKAQLYAVKRASEGMDFSVTEVAVKDDERPVDSFGKVAGGIDVLYLSSSGIILRDIDKLIDAANKKNVPAVAQTGGLAGYGVVLSLFANSAEQGEVAGRKTVQIMEGKMPQNIPVDSPKKVDFIVNMKAADKLGLKSPPDLIERATTVVH